jgi:hypothetical protein
MHTCETLDISEEEGNGARRESIHVESIQVIIVIFKPETYLLVFSSLKIYNEN